MVLVGTRPTEGDKIDRKCFKRLHLVYHGDKWLYRNSKLKTSHALGIWMVNYTYNDSEEPQNMDEDIPNYKPPL